MKADFLMRAAGAAGSIAVRDTSFRRPAAAEFVTSAARAEQFPKEALPEVAFLGRSNVGKSSLLNCLVGESRLAFTSARPGCTQLINFYRVDNSIGLVDLPGYGYARVPKAITAGWKQLIESYLLERENLALCILLLDARRGWMEQDLELKDWLELHNRPFAVVATKVDKLRNQKEKHESLAALRKHFSGGELLPFSAVTCRGAREIWQAIRKIKNPQ